MYGRPSRGCLSRATNVSLLQGLAERGFGTSELTEIGKLINAEKSDVFDVLAYVAYASPPITRLHRVEVRKAEIFAHYNGKLQAFLEFVLAQYVNQGVEELDQEKLGSLLELKYHTVDDAAAQLGNLAAVRDAFVGFQPRLYERD
ncbi:MAG: type I restriction-modification enzyme R subunit C-terminal domain-containing protein [Pseudolabrys sp.]